MSNTSAAPEKSMLVVCLCAAWCGVCGEYRERFEQVRAHFPQVQFLWIDVEDDADLLHPLDVENFPTLLLALGNEPRFLGTLTPQAQTLERLIRSQLEDAAAKPLTDRTTVDLVARIRAEKLG